MVFAYQQIVRENSIELRFGQNRLIGG